MSKNKINFLIFLPIMGIGLFSILYFIATLYYPGGSQLDKNAIGFSWLHNYWCNLLNEVAINGQTNKAQPISIGAMFLLCTSLIYFWILFPKYLNVERLYKLIIQTSGTISMIIVCLLFTHFDHDLITNLASLFGLIAMLGTFIGLHRNNWKRLFYFGILNILLIIINNILYYNKDIIHYLPLVQKFSFFIFLV